MNEASQQHEIRVLSSTEENTAPARESTHLLGKERQRISVKIRNIFYRRRQRCCLTSKAAILLLFWNLIIVAGLHSLFDPNNFGTLLQIEALNSLATTILGGASYAGLVLLFLFYPFAGCLADIQWGRYKTIISGLCVIWGSLVAMAVFAGVAIACILITPLLTIHQDSYEITRLIITYVLVGVVFGIPTFIGLLLLMCGLVCFSANIIQYGTDQLHDAPMVDSVLYIHWYVWTSYAGLLPMKLVFNINIPHYYSVCLISLPLLFLGVTLCIQRYKRHWFLIDSGSRNPYKLVYKVLKFAKDHTNPIRRSAFTYCENELPSRLDLGKEKYGGPITTEQVEDVKAFLGILPCIANSRTNYDGRLFNGWNSYEICQSS